MHKLCINFNGKDEVADLNEGKIDDDVEGGKSEDAFGFDVTLNDGKKKLEDTGKDVEITSGGNSKVVTSDKHIPKARETYNAAHAQSTEIKIDEKDVKFKDVGEVVDCSKNNPQGLVCQAHMFKQTA